MDFPSYSIRDNCYKNFIKPFLRFDLDAGNFMYFKDQAFRWWVLGFEQEDVKKIHLLQKGQAELCEKDPDLFITLTNNIFANLHDVRTIVEHSMEEYYGLQEADTIENYKKGFEYYKSLYESEFSAWITVFYAYIYECFKPSLKTGVIDYFHVSASQKVKTLEDQKFDTLLEGIDRAMRNAGSGHDSWEILDTGECIYHDVDPKTGSVKQSFTISCSDLREKVKKMEKAALLVELSLQIFLANNPYIRARIAITDSDRKPKIREIERMASCTASEYQLPIRRFEFEKDRSRLFLEVFHPRQERTIGASRVFTEHTTYDVVKMKRSVRFIDQALGIVAQIISMNEGNAFDLQLKISDEEKGDIFDGEFTKDELQNIGKSRKGKKVYPNSKTGELPDVSYSLIVPISVEPGSGDRIQKILDNPLYSKKSQDDILIEFSLD